MIKTLYKLLILCVYSIPPLQLHANDRIHTFNIRITGEDWGPAISEIILPSYETLKSFSPDDFLIHIKKCQLKESKQTPSCEKKDLLPRSSYRSNKTGDKEEGDYLALTLPKHPAENVTSPFGYDNKTYMHVWADMNIVVTNKKTNHVWNRKEREYHSKADEFKKHTFVYMDDAFQELRLPYASYEPVQQQERQPLIIWLHGGGEGGVDPNIVLLGNKVTNLASDSIQSYFKSANILVPQAKTFWPDQGDGKETRDGKSMYSHALMALIHEYVQKHPMIDPERIYIGGASNGGYMSLRMVIDNPQYFAAAFPICAAFSNDFLSDADIKNIRHTPIWFIHSTQDTSVPANETSLPMYKRLKKAGADKVVYTMYGAIDDKSKTYVEEDGITPYGYSGHASWIPALNNDPKTDVDGKAVHVAGQDVTLFEWLALQKRRSPSEVLTPPKQKDTIVVGSIGVISMFVGGSFLIIKLRKKHAVLLILAYVSLTIGRTMFG